MSFVTEDEADEGRQKWTAITGDEQPKATSSEAQFKNHTKRGAEN